MGNRINYGRYVSYRYKKEDNDLLQPFVNLKY